MNRCRITPLLVSGIILFAAALRVVAGAGASLASPLGSGNVLALGGNGNYLELPAGLFQGLNTATLECWVKWHTFTGNQHVFEFDAAKRVKVGNRVGQADLEFVAAAPPANAQAPSPGAAPLSNLSPFDFQKNEAAATSQEQSDSIVRAGALTLNRWHHLAVVFEASATQLYLDGTLVGSAPYTKGLAPGGAARHFMGSCSLYPNNSFHGELDEVRLWRVARTADQIRQDMNRALTGTEAGLAGLWNFDDHANPGRDASPNGNRANLVGAAPAIRVPAAPMVRAPAPPAIGALSPPLLPIATLENVLSLDGNDSYVELPPNIFNDLTEATVEGWVKWQGFQAMSRVFDFGLADRLVNLRNQATGPDLWVETFRSGQRHTIQVLASLRLNEWAHFALFVGTNDLKLYLNGVRLTNALVKEPDTFRSAEFSRQNCLGRSNAKVVYDGDQDFAGEMDEVRVWRGERTEAQIREAMARKLTGQEPGLLDR